MVHSKAKAESYKHRKLVTAAFSKCRQQLAKKWPSPKRFGCLLDTEQDIR